MAAAKKAPAETGRSAEKKAAARQEPAIEPQGQERIGIAIDQRKDFFADHVRVASSPLWVTLSLIHTIPHPTQCEGSATSLQSVEGVVTLPVPVALEMSGIIRGQYLTRIERREGVSDEVLDTAIEALEKELQGLKQAREGRDE